MGRKLTNGEYINKLKNINPNIHPLEKYDYAINKILHKCDICGNEWYVCPRDTLSGRGCPICGELKKKKFKSMSHEEYIQTVNSIHNTIKVLGVYQSNKAHLNHQCLICGYIWETSPRSILQGSKCPKCAGNYSYSTEDFIEKMVTINPNIKILGRYVNANTHIDCECKICSHKWGANPSDLLSTKGCPKCAGKNITNQDYKDRIHRLNHNISVIDDYINAKTKIKHKCIICEYEWFQSPSNMYSHCNCPKCSGNIKRTHKEFVNEIYRISPNVDILSEYVNSNSIIECECKICGHKFSKKAMDMLQGQGCAKCKLSKGERIILAFLESNCINHKWQYKFIDCKDKRCLPFDFYLPNYNMCIEYDGEFHYKPKENIRSVEEFNQTKQHDNIKTQYCQNNKIKLVRIPYWEFNNIEKILVNELGLNLQESVL